MVFFFSFLIVDVVGVQNFPAFCLVIGQHLALIVNLHQYTHVIWFIVNWVLEIEFDVFFMMITY